MSNAPDESALYRAFLDSLAVAGRSRMPYGHYDPWGRSYCAPGTCPHCDSYTAAWSRVEVARTALRTAQGLPV